MERWRDVETWEEGEREREREGESYGILHSKNACKEQFRAVIREKMSSHSSIS